MEINVKNCKHTSSARNLSKLASVLLLAVLIFLVLLGSCKKQENTDDANTEPQTKSPDFYVYLGDYLDPIKTDKLLMDYKKDTGLTVGLKKFSLNNNVSIRKALDGDKPALLYLAGTDASDYFSLSTGTGIGINAYGLAVNKTIIKEVKGFKTNEETQNYINSLSLMDFNTFNTEIIQFDSAAKSENKSEALKNFNGVFAFSGASKDSYGKSLFEATMLSLFPNETMSTIHDKLFTGRDQDLQKLISDTYADTLVYYTSMLAGKHASGIRGGDFSSDGLYGANAICDMLFLNKAAFAWVETSKLLSFSANNSCDISDISIIPIKIKSEGILSDKLMVRDSFRINEKSGLKGDNKKYAQDFLVWFLANYQKYNSSLENIALKYGAENRVVFSSAKRDLKDQAEQKYQDLIFSKDGIKKYLNMTVINEDSLNEMKQFLLTSYGQNQAS
jgi:hypothetical protein